MKMIERVRILAAMALGVSLLGGPLSGTAIGADTAGEVISAEAPGGLLDAAMFYLVASVAVMSALGVCFTKNIVRMTVWLFGALGSAALLYFLLAANFIAAIQLIVYAGGTLILLVFGVMLTSKSPWVKFATPKLEMAAAVVVCATLFGCLCFVLSGATWSGAETVVPGATVEAIGKRLLTAYVVPFEVAGVLLMIVMVAAAHLARQEK
ncbi:MAG: NADH-quinone oxidoreductase subunit J [Planctomycetes bacterium]|nr:NADH-quinone oxidoreductase subunit J [Planctomycetota bacterium]